MKRLSLFLMLSLTLAACNDGSQRNAVPRRYAYPRVELYDSTKMEVGLGSFRLQLCAEADTTVPGVGWLDVRYPRYGMTVHLSANSFENDEELQSAIANRRQRIELNFGEAGSSAAAFVNNAGIQCMVVGSPDAGSAPIYVLAVDSDSRHRRMLSGAAVFSGSAEPVDSIMPLYKAVYADMQQLLTTLK